MIFTLASGFSEQIMRKTEFVGTSSMLYLGPLLLNKCSVPETQNSKMSKSQSSPTCKTGFHLANVYWAPTLCYNPQQALGIPQEKNRPLLSWLLHPRVEKGINKYKLMHNISSDECKKISRCS
jgi:hypothetical protein